ncbi:hypothetical protein CI610_00358 [invertebrate metagenome]|uniref:Uncharacterized protein n=1 Tax=invertebrate metagenome TaxID=1711999 RepID=A0A2H9TBW8_9ZZZZ
MPDFPDIPVCRDGYGRNLSAQPAPVTFDAYARYRRRIRRRGCTDTVKWLCRRDGCELIEQFYRRQGTDWFTLPLPSHTGMVSTVVRFDGQLSVTPLAGVYEVKASLYVPDPPVMSAATLKDILTASEMEGDFMDDFHEFLHKQWPELMAGGHG